MRYLKEASKTATTGEEATTKLVQEMLDTIKREGENAVLTYSKKLDNYEGAVVVTPEEIAKAASSISDELKADIAICHQRVRKFAQAQRDSLQEFEVELSPGVWSGQKVLPLTSAGCYVPGGRYSHVCSAIMSVATAKVAGVKRVVACSAPNQEHGGIHPGILHALHVSGADIILCLGGVQAIAAMHYGLFGAPKVNILVGPGNKYVATAKQILSFSSAIDVFAGPTEIAIIADRSADPDLVAEDLCSQVEHGPESPAWLITTSEELGQAVLSKIDACIDSLPSPAKDAAAAAWQDFGEVVVCADKEEAAKVSDAYAAEHLELQSEDNAWYVDNLQAYGSLFIGAETTVTYGDKCVCGINHILPTKGAAHNSGGLSVHKFLKVVTTSRLTQEGSLSVAGTAARMSRFEGMEGHARAADIRLKKYAPP